MNLLTISLMTSCNKDPYCSYCRVRHDLLPKDYYFPPLPGEDEKTALKNRKYANMITKESLFEWINKYLNPDKWIISITGGEPALHPEINDILNGFNNQGYYTIIATNGSLPLPKLDKLKIVATWHCDQIKPPKYYDSIVILKDGTNDVQDKIKYCIDNDIFYRAEWLDVVADSKGIKPKFIDYRFLNKVWINASGDIVNGCGRILYPVNTMSIFTGYFPKLSNKVRHESCLLDTFVTTFLPEGLNARVKNDYNDYIKEQKKKKYLERAVC